MRYLLTLLSLFQPAAAFAANCAPALEVPSYLGYLSAKPTGGDIILFESERHVVERSSFGGGGSSQGTFDEFPDLPMISIRRLNDDRSIDQATPPQILTSSYPGYRGDVELFYVIGRFDADAATFYLRKPRHLRSGSVFVLQAFEQPHVVREIVGDRLNATPLRRHTFDAAAEPVSLAIERDDGEAIVAGSVAIGLLHAFRHGEIPRFVSNSQSLARAYLRASRPISRR